MSFRDCLTQAALRGAIKQGKLDEALEILDRMETDLEATGIPKKQAAEQAAKKAQEEIARQAVRKKQLAVLSHSAKQRVDADLKNYRGHNGNQNYAAAARAMIENDGIAPFASFQSKKDVYLGRFHSMIEPFINEYGAKGLNISPNRAGLDDVGRELFGEKTGNAKAKAHAEKISETFERARTTANSLGADIAKKDRYGLPQKHNMLKVAKAGKKAWIDYVLPRLDFARMHDAGGRVMTHTTMEERLDFLGSVWETIKTNGYVKAGDIKGRKALANRLGQHRFLEFKDFDTWRQYQEEFGDGDVFASVINHIESSSQQIAMLDRFGPNPHAMKQYIIDMSKKQAGLTDAARTDPTGKFLQVTDTAKQLGSFDEMWSVATGQNGIVANDHLGFTFAGIRNILTSAYLGSATLLAIPGDMVTTRMAKSISKLPSSEFLGNYVKNMVKSDNRQLAVRLGLIAEAATSIASTQYRYLGEVIGPGWTRRVSDSVMRASLMTGHTQAARWAHGMEWLGYFADVRGKSFDDLEVVDALKRAGITAEDWNTFRKAPLYEHEGAQFLRPDDLLQHQDGGPFIKRREVADKFMAMVIDEMQRAVPNAMTRSTAILGGATRPGTLIGEISRSFAMFKNFPVTITMLMYRNMMLQQGMANRAAFAATYGLMFTAAGALSLQMREIAKGRDPMNMNPNSKRGMKFWGSAALTGGGLTIWGDFLFRDVNRFGGGLTETIAGPVFSFGGDAVNLTLGNMLQAAEGKEANVGPEMLDFIRYNMPGSNIWYSRLMLQNGIMDSIQKEIDPDYAAKWRRQSRRRYNDYRQKAWWGRGKFSPDRAPDLGGAVNE